jgi:hypothetical protein
MGDFGSDVRRSKGGVENLNPAGYRVELCGSRIGSHGEKKTRTKIVQEGMRPRRKFKNE